MAFYIRDKCIICNNALTDEYFKQDLVIALSSYLVNKDDINKCINIPYNIYTCSYCKTSQTKYLGDLNLIYAENHADSTGYIMQNLHIKVKDLFKKYIDKINNIAEVGSSYGVLSNVILNELGNKINKYYIIEPSFMGVIKNKQILIPDFFENVDYKRYDDTNTIIISHVFEHFYNPTEILNKIKDNTKIENVLLVWPDLEYYKDNNVYHVLNTEHTFYIDNNLIKILFNNISFEVIEKIRYENHSVLYFFSRNNNLEKLKIENINYKIDNYYNVLLQKKEEIYEFIKINKANNKQICIWPASVHTQFFMMVLQTGVTDIDFVLDNSKNKIGKYLYGYNLECKSFVDNCNKENVFILNGGVFNKEVVNILQENNLTYITI